MRNSVSRYHIVRENLTGACDEPETWHDLMEIIMIRCGKDPKSKGIFDYIQSVFATDITRMEQYSNIPESVRKEAETMDGFGRSIAKKAYNQGVAFGEARGEAIGQAEKGIIVYLNLRSRGFSDEEAQGIADISGDVLEQARKRWKETEGRESGLSHC